MRISLFTQHPPFHPSSVFQYCFLIQNFYLKKMTPPDSEAELVLLSLSQSCTMQLSLFSMRCWCRISAEQSERSFLPLSTAVFLVHFSVSLCLHPFIYRHKQRTVFHFKLPWTPVLCSDFYSQIMISKSPWGHLTQALGQRVKTPASTNLDIWASPCPTTRLNPPPTEPAWLQVCWRDDV